MTDNVVKFERAFSHGQKRRLKKALIKAGRPRKFGINRQPNGQPSRRKADVELTPSWFAPSIARGMNMYTIDALEKRGAITPDQARAAYDWLGDRAATGLPFTAPAGLDMERIRASEGEDSAEMSMRRVGATRRYGDVTNILKQRCGVYGYQLAYQSIIEGKQPEAVAQYWFRIGQKQDPTERQIVAWQHLLLAFVEIEAFYALSKKRKLDRRTEAA